MGAPFVGLTARYPRCGGGMPAPMLAGMTGENDVPELVASVGPLDRVVVLLREFLHRSGALRAVAVVAGEPGEDPAVVDVRRLHPTEVEVGGGGGRVAPPPRP